MVEKKIVSIAEIKDKVKNIIKEKNNKNIDLIIKYYTNLDDYKDYYKVGKIIESFSQEEKAQMENLYLERIKKAGDNFILNSENIKELISMVSLAPIPNENLPILELPIEKSLRVFNKVEKIYLIYSPESESRFDTLKKRIENRYPKIEIVGKKIESDITKIYEYLKELSKNGVINNNTTLLDLTNGIKVSSIAIYKFAVEKSIKVINWVEKQLPKYKRCEKNSFEELENSERLPFSVTLEIMKEPILETIKSQRSLNIALERQEYGIVKNLYEALGEEDCQFFFEQLDELINFETMFSLNPDLFYKKAESFLTSIFTYKNFSLATKEKIKDFLSIMIVLTFYKADDDNLVDSKFWNITEEDQSEKLRRFKIDTSKFLDLPYSFIDEEGNSLKNDIYYYLVVNFFRSRVAGEKNSEKILSFLKNNIIPEKKSKNFKTWVALTNEVLNRNIDNLEFLNIQNKFINEIVKEIKLKSGSLRIEKYGLDIDLTEDEKIKKFFFTPDGKETNEKFIKILKALLNSKKYKLEKEEFISILVPRKVDSDKTKEHALSKYAKNIILFNEYIKNKFLNERKVIVQNFLILDRNKNIKNSNFENKLKNPPIKINKEFYDFEL